MNPHRVPLLLIGKKDRTGQDRTGQDSALQYCTAQRSVYTA